MASLHPRVLGARLHLEWRYRRLRALYRLCVATGKLLRVVPGARRQSWLLLGGATALRFKLHSYEHQRRYFTWR